MQDKKFKFIDLFAGVGGLRLAFESAGGECVFSSEWDRFARQTYAANHDVSEHEFAGDITKVDENDVPEHDVLVGGFPCQAFSLAGKRGGFSDTRGTLFFDVARIIKHRRPKAFVLENVKGLLSHDKGKTFATIRNVLSDELGYSLTWRIMEGQRFVPQKRERVVIVGTSKDFGLSLDDMMVPPLGVHVLGDILHRKGGMVEERFTDADGVALGKYVLGQKTWGYLQKHAAAHKAKGNGFGFGMHGESDVARTLSARYHKDGSEILLDMGEGNIPRRLTPRECARLQGYPDSFVLPCSDAQTWKQFGNSVVVPLFAAVASWLVSSLDEKDTSWAKGR